MGFRIFVHAIWLVFNHIGAALRISAFLYIASMLLIFAVSVGLNLAGMDTQQSAMGWMFIPLVVSVFCYLWIAVAWHRYVLLDEMPGAFLPPLVGDRVFAYLGKSIIVGLVTVLIALVVFIPVGFLVAGFASANPNSIVTQTVVLLPVLVAYFIIAALVYRFSLVLPATAVGKPIRLGEAWAATSGGGPVIFLLAFVSALCVVALEFVGAYLTGINIWLGLAFQLIGAWVQLLVGVSIITTLYGYFVEKRPIE